MEENQPQLEASSIIAVREFIQATRDSGYKGTSSALAELVDNALQAGAKNIQIRVGREEESAGSPITVSVQDDGEGMSGQRLRQALRFGGSSRFNSRAGLGRYGMGLPNSSLSQARRVEVYSWCSGQEVMSCYLDLDEIVSGVLEEVPEPVFDELPERVALEGEAGTLVVWRRCDRLDYRYPARQIRRLQSDMGRVFRHFIWAGVKITLNEEPIEPLDPLFLHPESAITGARAYGEPLRYELCLPVEGEERPRSGMVTVTFSELPVQAWQRLSNVEKRRLGITKGAGVSIIRGGREIDYGWFFMGSKRRENYDDWWRCELCFGPELDDVFGITHTKQQIRPSSDLLAALSPDLEAIARALNARVRRAHQTAKARARYAGAEARVSAVAHRLAPLARVPAISQDDSPLLRRLTAIYPELALPREDEQVEYRLLEDELDGTELYSVLRTPGRVLAVLNTAHPFYEKTYAPLIESGTPESDIRREQLELLFLSLARAEAGASQGAVPHLRAFRTTWADVLAEVLKG